MPRSKNSQSKHDKAVRVRAKKLESQGFKVKADIPGFEQPPTIRKFRPDILATRRKQKRIEEIETKDSVDSARDLKQQQAFKQSAKASKNTTFKRDTV
ncbi:hypothetical protein KAU86_02565 [bacterium]|nr:hypothetical protein [bacterium]MCK4436809.1 hypothetical protein [bacterium]